MGHRLWDTDCGLFPKLASDWDRSHDEAAGRIAREACVRRIEPFHFSPRYAEEEPRLMNEALAAFAGAPFKGTAAGCG